jgi:hypothetical protein
VPEQLRKRTLAVRGFDASGMMTGWEIVEGTNVEAAIERQFANVEAACLHIHFAAPGCYAAGVDRVGQADNVRFASLGDISLNPADVRFTPKSGHRQARLKCLQSAKSGHSAKFILSSRRRALALPQAR